MNIYKSIDNKYYDLSELNDYCVGIWQNDRRYEVWGFGAILIEKKDFNGNEREKLTSGTDFQIDNPDDDYFMCIIPKSIQIGISFFDFVREKSLSL